jgi:hypothetical protein
MMRVGLANLINSNLKTLLLAQLTAHGNLVLFAKLKGILR